MSTGWTAPGAGTAPSPQEQDPQAPGATGAHQFPAAPATAATPAQAGPAPRGPQRELVQELPLFPLRPLSVGEVLGAAVRIYRRRPKPMLVLSAAVYGVAYVLITITTGASMMPMVGTLRSTLEAPTTETTLTVGPTAAEAVSVIGSSLVTGVISMVAAAAVTAVLTRIAIGEASGEPVPADGIWPLLRRLALPAVGVSLLVGLLLTVAVVVPLGLGMIPLLVWLEPTVLTIGALLLGIVVAVVLGVWLYARTLLAVPALVIEELGVMAAVRRSFALTAGRRVWRVLGLALLLALLYSVAVQMLGGVFGMVGTFAYVAILLVSNFEALMLGIMVLTVLTMLGAYIGTFLLAPFLAAGTAAVYADTRMRHEAWDIELNRRARDHAAPESVS